MMYLIGNFCSWKNMVLGKYARMDGQNSSRYCMTISIVVFVSTCFIAAWMAMSSSIGPLGLQQFMSGMPKKANANNADLHKEALRVNDSGLNMQGDENVMPKEPQRSEVSVNDNLTMQRNEDVTPKEFQSSKISENDINPNMQGNENVTPKESQSSEVSESHDSEQIDENKDENVSIPPNVAEKSISWNKEENKRSKEKDNGPLENVDTINQDVPTEKYFDSDIQKHDGGNETKQVRESETKDKKSGGYPGKIPLAWINAKKQHDHTANQIENPSQGQHETDVTNDEQIISNGTITQARPWPTQAAKPEKAKELEGVSSPPSQYNYRWKVCNVTAGPDFIPCLDNIQAIKKLRTTSHYEHRERHCPDEAPICLVPLPKGYTTPIKWPKSRDMIWFSNVPHTKLAEYKGGQNWVKVYDRYLTFPGGGTQFMYGALHYIDYLEQSVPDIAWGRQSRVILDVGCGVASFGGYLFDRDVLTMSLAPKDEHEAQVQFALERGIPAISAVMGTMRLPFPSMVFDIIHCARCRVPWHVEGGKLLLELNRVLRPGGYFVWSATPVYRKDSNNVAIWKGMSELTKSICWELVKVERDVVNKKAAAIYRKPVNDTCYLERQKNDPPFCEESDDPSRAWYTTLESCIHNIPTNPSERGSQWPSQWPSRLDKAPYWLKGDDASRDFSHDYSNWKDVVTNIYLNGSGIDTSSMRNVMDMRASYGGFAAALQDLKVWVMNVVPVNSTDTLPIIYERGLFGIYHDWCESFNTYPRSYDLLHANHLFSDLKKRCSLVAVMAEVDRILRPGAYLIIRDDPTTVSEVESMANSLNWNVKFTHSKHDEKVFCVEKTKWRPSEVETISSVVG